MQAGRTAHCRHYLEITSQEMPGFACQSDYCKNGDNGYYKLPDFAVEQTWEAIVEEVWQGLDEESIGDERERVRLRCEELEYKTCWDCRKCSQKSLCSSDLKTEELEEEDSVFFIVDVNLFGFSFSGSRGKCPQNILRPHILNLPQTGSHSVRRFCRGFFQSMLRA